MYYYKTSLPRISPTYDNTNATEWRKDAAVNMQSMYNDALPMRAAYKAMIKYLGVACLITVFKFFKYMKIFRSTTVLWNTIDRAKVRSCAVFVLFLCCFHSENDEFGCFRAVSVLFSC